MPVRVVLLAALLATTPVAQQPAPAVHLVGLPAGGIQPHAEVDSEGLIHIVYFAGEPGSGDLFYTRLGPHGSFAPPLRVNSEPGSAIATGTIRGARLAVGRGGVIHVAWNGSGKATPKPPDSSMPMLYARLTAGSGAFEPQRNLIQRATGLDGGGAIAAGARGRVLVAWHAGGPGSRGEGDRRVWLSESTDDGRTFSAERAISPQATGACGCCGMDGLITSQGHTYFTYRTARDVVHRDSVLLASNDQARTFRDITLQEWNVGACPMSSYDLIESSGAVWAAWETGGQVQYAPVGVDMKTPAIVTAPGGASNRRHPSLALNARGEVLMSWSEGTGWQRGGSAAWQLFDKSGRELPVSGRAPGMPVWGLSVAVAGPDGSFTIIY